MRYLSKDHVVTLKGKRTQFSVLRGVHELRRGKTTTLLNWLSSDLPTGKSSISASCDHRWYPGNYDAYNTSENFQTDPRRLEMDLRSNLMVMRSSSADLNTLINSFPCRKAKRDLKPKVSNSDIIERHNTDHLSSEQKKSISVLA